MYQQAHLGLGNDNHYFGPRRKTGNKKLLPLSIFISIVILLVFYFFFK